MTDRPQTTDDQQAQVQVKSDAAVDVKTGTGKERDSGVGKQEVTPITEFTRKVDIEPEVEGWLEKLEKEDTDLQQPLVSPTDDDQVVVKSATPDDFKVVLPMSKDEVEKGIHHKVIDSVRWLAEWCVRMIKMFGNKVAYRKK